MPYLVTGVLFWLFVVGGVVGVYRAIVGPATAPKWTAPAGLLAGISALGFLLMLFFFGDS